MNKQTKDSPSVDKPDKAQCDHKYKYDEVRGGMEYEYYECTKCGDYYRLYYDDMQ